MPLYEYQCSNCEYSFERQLKIAQYKEPTENACPMCGEVTVTQYHTKGIRMADPVRLGLIKPPSDWQSFINRMAKSNPGSNFTTY